MRTDEDDRSTRFLDLLRPIQRELEVYCRRMIWLSSDLEDAVQNAASRAFQAFDRYREGTNFRAWMFKILTNEIFALNRKRGRIAKFEVETQPEEIESVAQPAAGKSDSDLMASWEVLADALDEDLVAALKELNEVERAVLLLRAIPDLRYREISESLEIPLGSVMGNLSRARQKMRDAIVRSRRKESL